MNEVEETNELEALTKWGLALKVLGTLWLMVGVIGGLWLALKTETEYGYTNKEYVNAGLGMSLAGASLVGGVLLATFGVFAMAYAESNAYDE
jgi:hypothetical protein